MAWRAWLQNRWFAVCIIWFSGVTLWRVFSGQAHYAEVTIPFLFLWSAVALGLWACEARSGKWICWLGWVLMAAYGSSILIGYLWKPWPHTPLQANFPHIGLADNQSNVGYILAWAIAAAAPFAFPALLALPFLGLTFPVVAALCGYLVYWRWWTLVLMVVAMGMIIYIDPPQIYGWKQAKGYQVEVRVPTTQDWIRVQVWKRSVELGMKKWVAGHGFGAYFRLSPRMWPPGNPITYTEQWRSPNNTLVLMFFNGGLVGLIAFMGGICSLAIRTWKNRMNPDVRRLIPVFVTLLVMSTVYEVTTMPSLTALAVLTVGSLEGALAHED